MGRDVLNCAMTTGGCLRISPFMPPKYPQCGIPTPSSWDRLSHYYEAEGEEEEEEEEEE